MILMIFSIILRDVTIHLTQDSIHNFDFTIRFDSQFYLNKMRFNTDYKLKSVLLLLLGQNATRFFVKLKYNTIIIY